MNTFEDYSALALRTAEPQDGSRPRTRDLVITGDEAEMTLAQMGLCGETGEIAEMIKKHIFHGHPVDPEKFKKEAGDVLWYLNYFAERCCGCNLFEIAELNVAKLRARYPEGFTSARSQNRADGDV